MSPDAKPPVGVLAAARSRLTGGGPIPPKAFLGLIRVEGDDLDTLDWDQACGLYSALRVAEADLTAAGAKTDVAAEFAALAKVLVLPGHGPPDGKRFASLRSSR